MNFVNLQVMYEKLKFYPVLDTHCKLSVSSFDNNRVHLIESEMHSLYSVRSVPANQAQFIVETERRIEATVIDSNTQLRRASRHHKLMLCCDEFSMFCGQNCRFNKSLMFSAL